MKLISKAKYILAGAGILAVYSLMVGFYKTQIIYDLVVESRFTFTMFLLYILWGIIGDRVLDKKLSKKKSWVVFILGVVALTVFTLFYVMVE